MTSLENWLSIVEMLMDTDGHLVMGMHQPMQVGDLFPDRCGFGIMYRVEGDAKLKDALRQLGLIEKFAGCRFEEPPVPPFFYKARMVSH